MYTKKAPKFSYSRLNTYDSCGWRYKLTYNDGHYIFTESVATLFGTLVHYMEEQIANYLKNKQEVPYDKLKKDFYELNIPKTSPKDNDEVFGINVIKQKYPEEFFKTNDLGESFMTKANRYLETGIYRLENYLNANPELEIYGMEQYFQINYKERTLSGYIDRIFHNIKTDEYIIEDIKTKDKPFREEDLEVPLQFVIYTKALSEMLDININQIKCAYDLPFVNDKQPITNNEYVKKGIDKLDEIFGGIDKNDFKPQPSKLCAYCQFSATFKGQIDEAKNLCPYYSLWTPGGKHKFWEVAHKWEGIERNEEILKEVFGSVKDEEFDF